MSYKDFLVFVSLAANEMEFTDLGSKHTIIMKTRHKLLIHIYLNFLDYLKKSPKTFLIMDFFLFWTHFSIKEFSHTARLWKGNSNIFIKIWSRYERVHAVNARKNNQKIKFHAASLKYLYIVIFCFVSGLGRRDWVMWKASYWIQIIHFKM